MIFADGHVHIYDCFEVDLLLDSALMNFQTAARNAGALESAYVLLLTESKAESWFRNTLTGLHQDPDERNKISGRWYGTFSEESCSLEATSREFPDEKLYIAAGKQLVTSERIEVLALFCGEMIDDGLSLADTVQTVQKQGGIPVLPWGAGKWFGTRGAVIESFLRDHGQGILFVGDNGGRPRLWPTPKLFSKARQRGVAMLPGTDPLPLPGEAQRVGSFGFYLKEDASLAGSPVTCLKRALLSGKTAVKPYGNLLHTGTFLLNQFRLRFSAGV